MYGCNGQGINSFALISYLPEPLAGFLDSLRCELVPRCQARSHVTILPPRPLASGDAASAWTRLNDRLDDFSPFSVGLDAIEIFPVTNVVYLAVKTGFPELEAMHAALNSGALQFVEPYRYHPHVTLAQELTSDQAIEAADIANRRWQEFLKPHNFVMDRLTFVQNTVQNRWLDLAEKDLAVRVAG